MSWNSRLFEEGRELETTGEEGRELETTGER